MLVLAFDTATSAVTVAVCEWAPGSGARIRAAVREVDRRRHAELLTPAITRVLADSDASITGLNAIVVGVGPGPYTGLRVGLVTARCLGDALRIPVHGVCTLDAIAWESGREEPFVVATDARRREVYWARYDSARERAEGPFVGKPADAAVGSPVVGPAGEIYAEVLGEATPPLQPSAAAMAELAVTRLAGGAGPELLPPEPLYLRRPDAREPGPIKRVTPS